MNYLSPSEDKNMASGKTRNIIVFAIGLIITAVAIVMISRRYGTGTEPVQTSGQKNNESELSAAERKRLEFRNDWRKYIRVNSIGYQPYRPDGIKGWTLTASNTSEYKLDYIEIEISYVESNGHVYQTRNFLFKDVMPKSMKTEAIPDSDKGTSIKYFIKNMRAESFDFCYDAEYDMLADKKNENATPAGLSGNKDDPWKCVN